MRYLRHQLIDMLDQARKQHRMDRVQPRLMAALVQDFLTLLPQGKIKRVAMRSRILSHGNLHRHIFTIRCPDQAFYLDAIKGYLLRKGIQPIGQQTMVARMACGPDGCDLTLQQPDIHDEDNFMFIALHISATLTPDATTIRRDIEAILHAVDLSVGDFMPMRQQVAQCIARLMPEKPDAAALLDWMNDNHYLLFGMQQGDKRFGIMRNKRVFDRVLPGLPAELDTQRPTPAIGLNWINLAAAQHYLYSEVTIEVLQICWSGAAGTLEHATVIGHCSRSARFSNASYLPVMAASWRTLASDPLLQHSAFYRREIRTLFDRMPKRILLATEPADWLEPLKAIIDLADPLQVVASLLSSREGNLDTLLVAMTSKRFGPTVLGRMIEALSEAGIVTHGHESFGIGPHRILLIGVERERPAISPAKLHDMIRHCVIFWMDIAKAEILKHPEKFDIPSALKELEQITPLYQELFPPAQFARDIQMRHRVMAGGRSYVNVSVSHSEVDRIELRIYSLVQPSLGKLVDLIRASALDPVEEAVVPFGKDPDCSGPDSGNHCGCIHISSITCSTPSALQKDDLARLRRALTLVFNDEADHDRLNGLIIHAGLDIDAVAILITLRNHLIQLLPDAAKLPLTDMMLRHPEVSAALHQLFTAHHLPAMPDDSPIGEHLAEARDRFHYAMQDVASLTDDRWFRALAEITEASLRTNAFMRETAAPIGIKIDPQKLSFAPKPKPYREIFLHGVHVEGVHLRAGPIARGGLRYSDRPSDFRTEVLELMSTQTIKNGQIVPTGSKGGFVVRDGSGPDFVLQQYHHFIRTLLALTDNLIDGEVVPSQGMVVPEEDRNDSYFVVAADKGTARYSDDANAESEAAGFWLGDAFASGGRYGYDHKAVGITARGAWVCAAHLFAGIGIDAYNDPITCVAVGDMGGDVFGNGMLLNPSLKLVAAFNHRHIFLDPNPDCAKAFAERKRLFAAVLGWDSYNPASISKGGGVFERSAKQIPLAADAQQALGIDEQSLSGEALIRAILAAPVDLLYNGGIGTYLKATSETHADVRDPANNSVRIDGNQLRCRVVCEGGNLGFTQLARIEYAKAGGLINTDAMDNSAGVDMSDHEVNLKILFAMPSIRLTGNKRNRRLEQLTEAVTDQCLADNRMQSRALTMAAHDAELHPPRLYRLRDGLRNQGWLDDAVAPDIDRDDLLHLRPQLSVLLGQEKNRLHEKLSAESFGATSAFGTQMLRDYFPESLLRSYGRHYDQHPLAQEIIHTQTVNHIVNHIGLCATHHLETLMDASTSQIIEALMIAEALLEIAPLREAIWQQVKDIDLTRKLLHDLQEHQMLFAENLLRLCPVETLDSNWIEKQRRGLARFRQQAACTPDTELNESGLSKANIEHLCLLPQLAQSACAVHLASSMQISLDRCLNASRVSLELLPIDELEQPLRSPLWAGDEAHMLRREWLHRLTMLQNRAIANLLKTKGRNFEQAAAQLWLQHPLWPSLQQHRNQLNDTKADHESKRLRLLLALTRLEAIVDNS